VRKLNALRHNGQGLVEYGLILVLIMVAITVILLVLGNQLYSLFSTVSSTIEQLLP
jgi:Flp pilus assembly pilin Flp